MVIFTCPHCGAEMSRVALPTRRMQQIVDYLTTHPGASSRELTRNIYKGHRRAARSSIANLVCRMRPLLYRHGYTIRTDGARPPHYSIVKLDPPCPSRIPDSPTQTV